MEIFYREKAFHAGNFKIKKNDFAPSEKCSCYAPGAASRALVVLFCGLSESMN